MKAFYVMFVVFAVLLLGVPIASAQDDSPSCSGGSAYDLTGHGCVTGYLNGSAAASSIAPTATCASTLRTILWQPKPRGSSWTRCRIT